MTTMHGKGEKEMKKVIVLITVFVCAFMLLGLAVGASGESTEPKLEIVAGNLSFEDSVALLYAVNVTGADADKAEMLYWTAPKGANDLYTKGTENYSSSPIADETVDEKECKVFRYDYLFAKEMTDYIYARAYITVGGQEYYSSVVKYSVLEYAYNMLGYTAEGSDDENLHKVLNNMLEYGASVQEYKNYKADRLATDTWYKVALTSGTLDDGFTHGLYLAGDKVTLTAPLTDADGATFTSWVNSNGAKVGATPVFELTVTNKNEVYTPVYMKYSVGLEIEEYPEDNYASVAGIGDCEDSDIVIPGMSAGGYPITEIDVKAFYGEEITSVFFPSTIESIGKNAFNGCDLLTDVYYDGTEEDWLNNVDIHTTGNDAIENATKHFNEPVVETFTVTFVDHDGTVLKSETVESGKSATPPQEPTRAGYSFTGWDKAYDNVTSDLTVMAKYTSNTTTPTFIVSNAIGSAGDTVEITVALKNNPGVTSMLMEISFDDNVLDLVSMTYNTEIGGTGIPLQSTSSPIKAYWAEGFNNVTGDWVFVTLMFNISDTATAGDYDITVTYNADDVYNVDETNVNFDIVNGKIVIE